jgi:hypothetical protein
MASTGFGPLGGVIMQGISRHTVGLVLLALITWSLNCSATVLAQDTQERRRERERESSEATQRAAPSVSNEPKDSISFTVWALTVGDAAEPPADELTANFADRVNNLPDKFSSADEVRKLVGRLKVAGMLRKSYEFRLTTLDGQSTEVRVGANAPRIVATSIDPQPDRTPRRNRNPQEANPDAAAPNEIAPGQNEAIITNAIMMEPLGTIVRVSPRIDSSGGLQVKVDYNTSHIEKALDVIISEVPGRKPLAASQVVTQQVETVVRLKSGTAVLVQADSSHSLIDDAPKSETRLLILAASVDPALE